MIGRLFFDNLLPRWITDNLQLWIRGLIVIGVLLLSATIAIGMPPLALAALGLLPFGIGVVLILMRWPALGLMALPPATIFVAFSIAAGSEYSTINPAFSITGGMLGLWVLDMILKRQVTILPSRTLWPLLAFNVVNLLAFGFGQLPWYPFPGAPFSAQLGGMMILPFATGAFLLTAHQIKDLRWLEWITWLFLAAGALFIAVELVPPLRNFANNIRQPGVNGSLEYGLVQSGASNGSLLWLWLVALAFSQAVFNRRLHIVWRAGLGLLVMVLLYQSAIVNREWASGWIPSVAAIGVIVWVSTPQLRIMVTIAGVLGAMTKLSSFVDKIVYGENAYSTVTRLEAYAIVLQIAKVNPIIGLGHSNYYYYSERFPIRGYYVKFNSHSNIVDIIAQTGILGLACFFWFFWEVGLLGWRLRNLVPEGGFAQAYVYSALGGIVGMIVAAILGDWVLPFVYNIGFSGFRAAVLGWFFLGGLVAIEQIYVVNKKERVEA